MWKMFVRRATLILLLGFPISKASPVHRINKTKSIITACFLRFTYTAHEHTLKIKKKSL